MKDLYIQQKKRFSRKSLSWIICAVLALSTALLCLLQQRRSTYSSKLIARFSNPSIDFDNMEWTSPSSAAMTVSLLDDHHWHLYGLNVESHSVTDIKTLSFPTKFSLNPLKSFLCLSPDGQKLLLEPDTMNTLLVTIKTDGSDYHKWGEQKESFFVWNQDSVRWMTVTYGSDTLHHSAEFAFHDLSNPSANPHITVPLGVQIPVSLGFPVVRYTQDGRFVASTVPEQSLVSSDTIVNVDFHKQPVGVSVSHIHLPEARICAACISPSGNRVAYLLARKPSDSIPYKIAHALHWHYDIPFEIWIGKPGEQAKYISQIENIPSQKGLGMLRWLPDEQKISYVYIHNQHTNIYTMDL